MLITIAIPWEDRMMH